MPTSALALLLAALVGQTDPAAAEATSTAPAAQPADPAANPTSTPFGASPASPASPASTPSTPSPASTPSNTSDTSTTPAAPAEPAPAPTVEEPLTAASRLTLIGSPEVNLVGLSYGLRVEVNYRPFEPGTVSRLRLAMAFDYGAEFFYLPVALGYRAVFRQSGVVRPLVGLGLELQSFFITDAPVIRKVTGFLEGGVLFALDQHWEIGLVASLEYAPAFSPGLCTRLQIGHTF